MNKVYSVAIIGCGNRGWTFGNFMLVRPNMFKVKSVCDYDDIAIKNAKEQWSLLDENVFSDEKEFFKEKRADVLVIATQDRDHVRMCVKAMELGYDILLEKPISPLIEELKELLDAQEKYKRKVLVCHVLRYAPAFVKVKEILNSGVIGRLIHVESVEQVGYWHQAHSFVRGNWRNDQTTSPMIMAKCCHDLDLLQYYVGAKCDTVYSVGSTAYFNKANQPDGASDKCQDCKYKFECPYSAERLYVERWKELGCLEFGWPFSVVCKERPNTEEKLRKAYENNEYGRCVFACDNNVVDNQQVMMTFENGINVVHTMSAFTKNGGRNMTFHGTLGEIQLDSEKGITVNVYGAQDKFYDIKELLKETDGMGHGGGDSKLVEDLYDVLNGNGTAETTLEKSVESHLMAIAAEKSRKENRIVKVHDDIS